MKPLDFDLCIIGTGPGGIITALEYSKLNPSKSICLIEFGKPGMKTNRLDDSIRILDTKNHHEPYNLTNKEFGGSTKTWGGRCVMYDKIDFLDRPILSNNCTWNLDVLKDLKKYLKTNSQYFDVENEIFDLREIKGVESEKISEFFVNDTVTDYRLEKWSKPTRFGIKYRKDIEKNEMITLLEGYEARDFKITNGDIDSITIYDNDKGSQEVSAGIFVIAAGTFESTRLLLSNKQIFDNLREVPSALGRYYQSHLSGKIASITFNGAPEKTDYEFLKDGEVAIRRRFQFTTDFLLKSNLLNTAIWLDNALYYDPKHKNGAMSVMYLAMLIPFIGKRLEPPAINHSVTKGKNFKLNRHFMNVLKDFPKSITLPMNIFYRRYLKQGRKLPGVFLYNKLNNYALHFHSEQIPYEGNCLTLDKEGKLLVNYKLLDEDVDSIIRLHEELDKHLKKHKIGKLNYWFEKEDLHKEIREMSKDGLHQSGTTRMAKNSDNGVVDFNLKVFGTNNLYVSSASNFPTSSQANPTYMIGAFAVRLAHHLTNK